MSNDAELHDLHDESGATQANFDTNRFLQGLDSLFEKHEAATKADAYLQQALIDAENAKDNSGLLTVLNETMGFYRSQGRHQDNAWIVQRALELMVRMGLQGTEAWTTTLINAATAMRAAQQYEQSEDLYQQALTAASQVYAPNDRRLAALHNNLSMLYSETGRLSKAQHELESALAILSDSSVNTQTDIDIASTHTNIALVLLEQFSHGKTASNTIENPTEHPIERQTEQPRDSHEEKLVENTESLLTQAAHHAQQALTMYREGHLEHSAHFASALAGYAQVAFCQKRFCEAVQTYQHALRVIGECYGTDTDYYRITKANLQQAQQQAELEHNDCNTQRDVATLARATSTASPQANNRDEQTDTISNHAAENKNHLNIDEHAHHRDSGKYGTQLNITNTTGTTEPAEPESATEYNISASHRASVSTHSIRGLQLAREYWNTYGKPLIERSYPQYRNRIAAGLVGHGSQCFGFDDVISQDHDFAPGFCLWLVQEDYAAIGERLQHDIDLLPKEFLGFTISETTPRAEGTGKRLGVFEIGDFFESITGYPTAPAQNKPYEWLMLSESTLATATNGEVFADPLGMFMRTRQSFKMMPDDVRLALISRRLGYIAQAGQYNFPRMLKRGDGAAAVLCLHEFVDATSSLVFLLNNPVSVGYLPYYKWQFAALRKLSARMASCLPEVCSELERIFRLASAACFGGAAFGEGGKGSDPAQRQIVAIIEHICENIVHELHSQGLTTSRETFLEWQRPYIEEHIVSDDPSLRSL